MHGKVLLAGLAAACVFLAAPPVRAGYDITTSLSDPANPNLHQVTSPSSMSNIQFSDLTHNTLECDLGGSIVHLVRGQAFTGSNDPDPFDSPYRLTVQINDYDHPTPGILTFDGRIIGQYSNRRSNIANQYEGPRVKSIQLGARTYTVTLLDFVPPLPPVSSGDALFTAHITCAPTALSIASVELETATVAPGDAVEGTVTLNGPAPRGGSIVEVSSSNTSAVVVPSPVVIPEGETTALFAGVALAAAIDVELEAAWNSTQASATVSVGTALCGDFDGNQAVDLVDVSRLLRSIAGLEDLPAC